MKKLKIVLLVAAISNTLHAQDTIYTKSGTTIPAKVFEVTQNEIRYQKSSNLEGPIYTIDKSNVSLIEYKNGTKDVFSSDQTTSSAANNSPSDDVYNQGEPQTVVSNNYYNTSSGGYNPGVSMSFMLGMPSLFWGVPYYAGPWGGWPYYRSYYRPYWAHNYYHPWGSYAWGGWHNGWKGSHHVGGIYYGPRGSYGSFHGGNGGYHGGSGGYHGGGYHGGGGFHGGHHR